MNLGVGSSTKLAEAISLSPRERVGVRGNATSELPCTSTLASRLSRESITAKRVQAVRTFLISWLVITALNLPAANKKVVVLGIDGMDPKLLQTFVEQER